MIWVVGFVALFIAGISRSGEAMDYLDEKTQWWTRFDSLFKKYGQKYGVKWEYLKTTSLVESDLGRAKSVTQGLLNPTDIEGSKSSDGLSWGIMQVTLTTARDFDPSATVQKLNNPEYSVDLAARYWARTMKQFSTQDIRWLEWVVKSYNQGAGNTLKELAGKTKGYTGDYWLKWQKQYQRVMEGK
jgi:hypothetical protein